MSERIDGLPIGTKIGRVRYVADGRREGVCSFEPDNEYRVLDLATVPIPDGYERDGNSPEEWFRSPRAHERYVHPCGAVAKNDYDLDLPSRIIVRPIKKTKRVLVVEVDEKDCVCGFEKLASAIRPGCRPNSLSTRIEERDE